MLFDPVTLFVPVKFIVPEQFNSSGNVNNGAEDTCIEGIVD
jgi:hypothetical protein